MNAQHTTSYIKHLAVSGLSSVSARIKSSCNLTGKCFEMPNVSYTQPLGPIAAHVIEDVAMCVYHIYMGGLAEHLAAK